MTEFGDIFDFQLSTMVFCSMTVAFMAAYGLVAAWSVRANEPALQPA